MTFSNETDKKRIEYVNFLEKIIDDKSLSQNIEQSIYK